MHPPVKLVSCGEVSDLIQTRSSAQEVDELDRPLDRFGDQVELMEGDDPGHLKASRHHLRAGELPDDRCDRGQIIKSDGNLVDLVDLGPKLYIGAIRRAEGRISPERHPGSRSLLCSLGQVLPQVLDEGLAAASCPWSHTRALRLNQDRGRAEAEQGIDLALQETPVLSGRLVGQGTMDLVRNQHRLEKLRSLLLKPLTTMAEIGLLRLQYPLEQGPDRPEISTWNGEHESVRVDLDERALAEVFG